MTTVGDEDSDTELMASLNAVLDPISTFATYVQPFHEHDNRYNRSLFAYKPVLHNFRKFIDAVLTKGIIGHP